MMPHYIKSLYRYFCKSSFEALRRFYNWRGSREFVKRFGVKQRKFYVRYIKMARDDDPYFQSMKKYYKPVFNARSRRKIKTDL